MRKKFESQVVTMALWCLMGLAVAFFGYYLHFGPTTIEVANFEISKIPLAIALRMDALSSIMFLMVSVLSAVVSQYALRYLDGEKNQPRFHGHLLATVLAVCLLVLSNNLLMFFAAWLGISWGLHKLLLFYEGRPAAVAAAKKKFLVSRVGDLLILGAIILLYKVFGTFSFDEIFTRSNVSTSLFSAADQFSLQAAALLLAAGAMTKSVQFPFHFWLPETMETPTPVSALMHAGIINAGGFLILRLSPVIAHSTAASTSVALLGAFTAVYGALVMATQNSIKSKLAYSTISQMGMMMFACGIGAYTLALFHIIAHSLYKAHAFLTTGALVEEKNRISLDLRPKPLADSLFMIAICYSFIAVSSQWKSGIYLTEATYVSILLLGIFQSIGAKSPTFYTAKKFYVMVTGVLVLALTAYVAMEHSLDGFLGLTVDVQPSLLACSVAFSIFAAGLLIARELMLGDSSLARRMYVTLWNDCFLGVKSQRVLSKIWPN